MINDSSYSQWTTAPRASVGRIRVVHHSGTPGVEISRRSEAENDVRAKTSLVTSPAVRFGAPWPL